MCSSQGLKISKNRNERKKSIQVLLYGIYYCNFILQRIRLVKTKLKMEETFITLVMLIPAKFVMDIDATVPINATNNHPLFAS